MERLFKIQTARVELTWSAVKQRKRVAPVARGMLRVKWSRPKASSDTVFRTDVVSAEAEADQDVGPMLFEETDYALYVHAASPVRIRHTDPVILRSIGAAQDGCVAHGLINFGSDVGLSEFVVEVDGQEEFRFEVEVFPSKLDYRSDYNEILAEVQGVLAGLALEYLRSTHRFGAAKRLGRSSDVEWLLLLKNQVNQLERALRFVAMRPVRRMIRSQVMGRADKVRRVDSAIRSQVLRGGGSGVRAVLSEGVVVRERIVETQARATLDTPEHRWLADQVRQIRRRLARIRGQAVRPGSSSRRERVVAELAAMEGRMAALEGLEPLEAASSGVVPGFASLQLVGAPGYREAYLACMFLTQGLSVDGGLLRLSVKKLSELYEYWCFLTVVQIVLKQPGMQADLKPLFAASRMGLQVRLATGHESKVKIRGPAGRKLTVTYNPRLNDESMLVSQRPDILISIEDPGWPELTLILDAKYRLDSSAEYVSRYNSVGPPEDALNVLHRYRDAILDWSANSERPAKDGQARQAKRKVVQAVALFPLHARGFKRTRLWKALESTGVGAIPLLPGTTRYLERWIRMSLRRGPWALADRVVPHGTERNAQKFRAEAEEVVLVGSLRGDDPKGHLEWIERQGLYYIYLARSQPRQFSTRWVALFEPGKAGKLGAVTKFARVESVEVRRRDEVATPWTASGDKTRLVALYRLSSWEPLTEPLENVEGQRFGEKRWSSKLALHRARSLSELSLETEAEWRLLEALCAAEIQHKVTAGPIRTDGDALAGHARFVGMAWEVRYLGGAGFEVKRTGPDVTLVARPEQVIGLISRSRA